MSPSDPPVAAPVKKVCHQFSVCVEVPAVSGDGWSRYPDYSADEIGRALRRALHDRLAFAAVVAHVKTEQVPPVAAPTPQGPVQRQFERAAEDVKALPDWLRRPRVATPTPETPSPELQALSHGVMAYLTFMSSDIPLNEEFRMLRGRVVTLACNYIQSLAGAVSHPQPDPRTTNDDEVARVDGRGLSAGFGTAGSDAGAQDDSAETTNTGNA